jgi:hypothetical protein
MVQIDFHHEIQIKSYRDLINYINFIDGLLYIIKNNPIIYDICNQESCYYNNKSKKFKKRNVLDVEKWSL